MADAYDDFLATGAVPGVDSPTPEDRLAFVRVALTDRAFKAKAWPHFACFVDASNVARSERPRPEDVNAPQARLGLLVACEGSLRKLGYVPLMVSDGNLFRLMDDPYAFEARYLRPPHSVAKGYQADRIVLQALRKLPEAAVVSCDRFDKPEDLRHFADVLADRSRFFAFEREGDGMRFHRAGAPMPSAVRRLVGRWPS